MKVSSIYIGVGLFIFQGGYFMSAYSQNDQGMNQRPNIILITADDLGFQLGCYGDKIAKTPNIDSLVNMGIRFDNAYVCQASSSSSRSSLLTGMYPHQSGQLGLAHCGFSIRKDLDILPNVLKKNGYRTGIIGKLHVAPEEFFQFDYANKPAPKTREVVRVANEAESFMKAGDTPFFLYLNYFDPHVPLLEQVDGIPEKPYTDKDVKELDFQGINHPQELERIANYYSCVERLDYGIGELFKKLENNNLLNNTLIIFLSDNGINFTRGKTTCYETGVRVPMFAVWKNNIKSNSVTNSMVSEIDIFPTICELLNIDIPEDIEGMSFLDLLDDPNKKHRNFIFSEFTFHGNSIDGFYPRRAIFDGRYKLIYNVLSDEIKNPLCHIDGDKAFDYAMEEESDVKMRFKKMQNPGVYELYDIDNDPYELEDLSEDKKLVERKSLLIERLIDWMNDTNDLYSSKEYSLSIYKRLLFENK